MHATPPLALLALAVAACALVGAPDEEFSPGGRAPSPVDLEEVARRAIDAGDIRRYLAFLDTEAMRNRETPGRELDRAASWIAERLREAGLDPAGHDGGYVQFRPHGPAGDTAHAPNVVAVLPGADPARSGEYVVLVTHIDDPAGTAALLEIAEAFGALPAPPARPLLLLVVSGERGEPGGAEWFARNPTLFLTDAVAALAIDRPGTKDTVAVVGHAYSGLGPLLDDVVADAEWLGVRLRHGGSDGGAADAARFRRGEHYPFARAGIPAVTLTPAGGPDDTGSERGDRRAPERIARVARLAFLAAHRLAGEEARIEWTAAGREWSGRR